MVYKMTLRIYMDSNIWLYIYSSDSMFTEQIVIVLYGDDLRSLIEWQSTQ